MKIYLQAIQDLQKILLTVSILILAILPVILSFFSSWISPSTSMLLYDFSHVALFFVMMIRPLADIFTKINWLRPLVILRKGAGVFSASIIVAFIFSKIIIDPVGYFSAFGTAAYWSMQKFALLAHLGDITAIILLITSNNFSKRALGLIWWKRIQRLAYVYYYASSFYVLFTYSDSAMIVSMTLVTLVTIIAFIKNRAKRAAQNFVKNTAPTVTEPSVIS